MCIYIYKRPEGDMLIIKNKRVYDYMIKNNLQDFTFGILLRINDYEWHHDSGYGRLLRVFNDYEEAKKHKIVYPTHGDVQNAQTDKPIKIIIKKQIKRNMIKIVIDDRDAPLWDIMHPDNIGKIIPI